MGHDHQQSSSSGAVIAIVVAVPLVAIIGIVAVAGAWLLVRTSSVQSQAVTSEQLTVELHGAETETRRAVAHVRIKDGMVQIQQSSDAATPETRLNFAVTLDREGNASVDGEEIDLDELRAQLAKLKDETSNAFSVQINADPECPVTHVIPVIREQIVSLSIATIAQNADERLAVERASHELEDDIHSSTVAVTVSGSSPRVASVVFLPIFTDALPSARNVASNPSLWSP